MQSNQSSRASERQLLLNLLAQRLDKGSDEIIQCAENGNLPALMQNMNPNDAAALQKVLNDQQAIQRLVSSSQAQNLMRRLNGQK